MEQEQILSTLIEQLGQTSLSERTLRDYVSENIPEEGKEFNFERHVRFLKSLDGNFSHDVAAQVEDFKKNYNPQPKETDKDNESESKKEKDSVNESILRRLEELENHMKESNKISRESSLKAEVDAMKDSLKVHNKNLWKDCVNSLEVNSDDTHDSLVAKAKKLYEKKLKEYFGDGAAPYGGKTLEQSQADTKRAKDAQDAFEARMKARTGH